MTYRSPAPDWPSVLRRLSGGSKLTEGARQPNDDVQERLIAAVACPETWSVPPERLFGLSPAELYVIRTDLGSISLDLLAGLEWAADQGAGVGVVFGDAELCTRLEVLLAPHGMTILEAVLGPDDRVRFTPRSTEASAQILRSR